MTSVNYAIVNNPDQKNKFVPFQFLYVNKMGMFKLTLAKLGHQLIGAPYDQIKKERYICFN